jgi:hypothetical protein
MEEVCFRSQSGRGGALRWWKHPGWGLLTKHTYCITKAMSEKRNELTTHSSSSSDSDLINSDDMESAPLLQENVTKALAESLRNDGILWRKLMCRHNVDENSSLPVEISALRLEI